MRPKRSIDRIDDAGDGLSVVSGVERASISILNDSGETTTIALDRPGLPRSDQFVVGDMVTVDRQADGMVTDVRRGPRRTWLSRFRSDPTRRSNVGEERILAANVDVAVIVVSATDVKPRLIDRYLIVAQSGNVEPIICVNKIDRWSTTEDRLHVAEVLRPYESLDIAIVYVSATRGDNLHLLRAAVEGRVSVFSGLSGVGKSSLVNALFGSEVLNTREVRSKDDRGRHTTTSSSVVPLGGGTLVIDTPGIRQLQNLAGDTPILLRNYFPEIRQIQAGCQFANCLHIEETHCAVKEAVLAGRRGADSDTPQTIPYARYDSYLRLADPTGERCRRAEQRAGHDMRAIEALPWLAAGGFNRF